MSKIFVVVLFVINLFFNYLLNGQVDNLIIKRFTKIPINTVINQMKVDEDNTLYIASTTGVLTIKGEEVAAYHTDKNVMDIAINKNHGAWIADKESVYELLSQKSVNLGEKGAIISSLDFFNDQLYVGSNRGVFIVNMKTLKAELKHTKNSELKSNIINFVYADSKGRCWLGTKSGEVRIEKDKWQVDHADKDITHFYENKEGMWFISTNQKRKQEMWLIDHYNRSYDAGFGKDLYTGVFNDFAIDSKGMLYFASNDFIKFNPYEDNTKNFTENAGVISQKCTATICDKNDVIWIGTEGDGLFQLQFNKDDDSNLHIACITEKKPTCSGKNDGVIRVITTGGTAPYIYTWSNPAMNGNNPKNVTSGNYNVTVTDANGAKQICYIDVPNADFLYLEVVTMEAIKSFNGKEGKIKVKAVGGAGDYKYQWQDGSNKDMLEKLVSGNYSVTVTDKNKCSVIGEYQLSREKILPDLAVKNIEVGKTLRIDELYFKADSSEITAQSFDVLNEVLVFLQQNPSIVVEIGGHTNTIPSHEYCDKLSSERAKSVATYFYQNGIPVNRLSFKGYGKRQPISDSVSLEGRKKNQRVEIKIISI